MCESDCSEDRIWSLSRTLDTDGLDWPEHMATKAESIGSDCVDVTMANVEIHIGKSWFMVDPGSHKKTTK